MRFVLLASLLAVTGAAIGIWVIPVDLFQNWNVARIGDNPYAQFEAAGQAEFLTWLGRLLLPGLAVCLLTALSWSNSLHVWIRDAIGGLIRTTDLSDTESPKWSRCVTYGVRLGVIVWLGLFCAHAVYGVLDRGRDWAYFRSRSGDEVLPNISFENRDVIRYLRQATPEDARILVCSDQSVFFLSYYLRPRRLFHVVHPDAEFMIPKPGQTRPLAAYRLDELDPDEVAGIAPDFVVEYYEGTDYVTRDRLAEDTAWVRFWQQSQRRSGLPPYLVSLRPFQKESGERPSPGTGGRP